MVMGKFSFKKILSLLVIGYFGIFFGKSCFGVIDSKSDFVLSEFVEKLKRETRIPVKYPLNIYGKEFSLNLVKISSNSEKVLILEYETDLPINSLNADQISIIKKRTYEGIEKAFGPLSKKEKFDVWSILKHNLTGESIKIVYVH